MTNAAPSTGDAQRRQGRLLLLGIAAVGLLAIALAFAFGSPVTQVLVVVVTLTTFQGAAIGAAETAGLVVSLLLAALLAFPIGRLIEDAVGGALGVTGLMKRGAGVAIAAVAVLLVGSLLFGFISRRVFRKNRRGMTDRSIGGALGLAEGVFLGLFALWALMAIEPVAQSRLASAQTSPSVPAETNPSPSASPVPKADAAPPEPTTAADETSNALARRVLAVTESARGSAFGRLAQTTNPFEETPVVRMADDYLVVVRDPDALAWFLESDAVRRFNETPSVRRAIETLQSDPEIRAAIQGGLDRGGLRSILDSDEVLRVLDETTVIEDIEPIIEDLRAALDEAKHRARR
jgi:uncharacterized membrane protein required for colicin V production